MSKRKSIAIDLDSTLNNLDEVWMERYNEDWDDNLTVLNMTDWDTSTIVKPECGQEIFKYFEEEGFFANLGIRKDAREVTEELAESYDLYIVTAFSTINCVDKEAWVKRELPNFNIKNLVFCNPKYMFAGAEYLVDDGGHNAEAFPNKVLLYDNPCPWNHYLGNQFERAHNWEEVRNYFIKERKIDKMMFNGMW